MRKLKNPILVSHVPARLLPRKAGKHLLSMASAIYSYFSAVTSSGGISFEAFSSIVPLGFLTDTLDPKKLLRSQNNT